MATVRQQYSANKKILIIIGIFLVALTFGGIMSITTERSHQNKSAQLPQYETLLPTNKSIAELGGWNRVSPPDKSPVFSYTDKIENIFISVSEQPLPDAFKSEPELQTSKLAESYNATTKFDANGTTVYLGNSAAGPQSIIFTKNNLLILIKSQNKINEKAWISYIQALR